MKEKFARELEHILQNREGMSIEEKDESILINIDSYAVAGYVIADLLKFARENDRTCVVTIQAISHPKMQIVL